VRKALLFRAAIDRPVGSLKPIERTSQRQPVLVSWSGGKDSCMALREILNDPDLRVEALLTTFTRDYDRVSMHGVRRALLERQADSLGIPLHQIPISKSATNAEYETRMAEAFAIYREHGTNRVVFGDLFLEEIRAYRERMLTGQGMLGLFPLWQRDTLALIREFLHQGFKTAVVCVDPKQLDPSFLGRVIDQDFLSQLPAGVDPCGENGEFHTFVFDGPIFRYPIKLGFGERVCRDSFWFCDLLPID
jgi:uncharacterized protein (TIGR00290 family)